MTWGRGRGASGRGGGRAEDVGHSRSKTLLTASRGGRNASRKMNSATQSSRKTLAEKTSAKMSTEKASSTAVGRGKTTTKTKDVVTENTKLKYSTGAEERQSCDPGEREGRGLQSPTVSTLTSSPRPLARELPQKRGVADHQKESHSERKDNQLDPVSPSLHSRYILPVCNIHVSSIVPSPSLSLPQLFQHTPLP